MAFRARRFADLAPLAAFLDTACAGIDADARADLRLATEEVFANIFKHGYRGLAGPVDISVSRAPGQVTVLVADQAPAFDPATAPAPDLQLDCAARGVGGLGWHLVHQVVDDVGWERAAGGGNVYRLVKHVASDAPEFPHNTEERTHMNIELQPGEHAAVVVISGSVDGLTAEHLLGTLQGFVEAGQTRLVADLAGVLYTSSAGLRALLATVKQARQGGGDLRLASINPPVLKVLELSGFTTIMKCYDDVASAIGSYAG
jgi:anti-anti-sigma factor